MKLATFTMTGRTAVGVVNSDTGIVVDLAAAVEATEPDNARNRSMFGNMIGFLETGVRGMRQVRRILRVAQKRFGASVQPVPGISYPLGRARLRPPVTCPRKLFCLAGNYQDHIEEGGGRMAAQDKETPRVFMKPSSTTVIGPGDRILIPPVARAIDWEGELAVVMGRRAKAVSADQALGYVAGYTIMNDVSERQLLIKERSESRPRDKWFDWLNGKWLDTFAPQGPWIVTADEIADPQCLDISTWVNGERKQHNNTRMMLYPVADIIEYISAIITLEPGDLISTGTIAGVGAATGSFLQPGDRVAVSITGIGTLRNRVAASKK